MAPKPGHGILRYTVVVVTAAVIVEDGKLLLRHHVGIWLRLDPAPDIADLPFKHCSHRRGYWAVLVFFGYLKGLGQGEGSATHIAVMLQKICSLRRAVRRYESRSDGSD